MNLADKVAEGHSNLRRGTAFEFVIQNKLNEIGLSRFRNHVSITGFTGTKWIVDFLVEDKLLMEVSLQTYQKTKIEEVFLKFSDILKAHPEFKACLVFGHYYRHTRKSNSKKSFPVGAFFTMMTHDMPILLADDMSRLPQFIRGELGSRETGTMPSFTLHYTTEMVFNPIKEKLLKLLSDGIPRKRSEISQALGLSLNVCDPQLEQLLEHGKLIKVSSYYGLDVDTIRHYLAINKRGNDKDNKIYVRDRVELYFVEHPVVRLTTLAKDEGLTRQRIYYAIHLLNISHKIRRVGKGIWMREDNSIQSSL